MRAYLNNIELTPEVADLQAISITYTGRTKSDYSDRVAFTGWAFDLIKSELIDDPKGYIKSLPFRVERTCCGGGIVFEGAVRGDKIDWQKDGCIIDAAITQEDVESEYIRKINSTLISESLPLQNPVIFAASGKNVAGVYITILINYILISLMLVLIPVVGIIAAIVSIFDKGALDAAMNFMNEAIVNLKQNAIAAIGQRIPTPFVREILQSSLNSIGLDFESSILTDAASPYFNLAYAAIQQVPYKINSTQLLPQNLPIRTIGQFLEELVLVFDASWDIYGDKLLFERRDSLPDADVFDITEAEDLNIKYSWTTEQKNAYFDLQYSLDIDEKGGNGELDGFNEIVEWNAANNENQSGALVVQLPFSPYSLGFPFSSSGISALLTEAAASFGAILPSGKQLEFSGQFMYVPKLVLVEPQGNRWKATDPTPLKGQQLYDNFYFIEDPLYSNFRGLEFDAEFIADCDFLSLSKDITRVIIPYGNTTATAYVNSIEVNFSTNKARIRGNF